MKIYLHPTGHSLSTRGFTLAEVLISLAISAVMISGIIYGYTMTTSKSEWSAYSLAANSIAMQRLEQVRACKYNLTEAIDQVVTANFPTTTAVLDASFTGLSSVTATNIIKITSISANPPLKGIQVDCVWYFAPRKRLFTNTIVTYRAPD